jgi:hypothetical protein
VIVDFHTHIFPPDVRDNRADYLRTDPVFAGMYENPKAKIATADDLLKSMEQAGVDISVAAGFAWADHERCVRHNDYLLESAARSGGRIVPFCTLNPSFDEADEEALRCARAGARGFGELRPDSQGWDLNGDAGEVLAKTAQRFGLSLLFHVTEPIGREYDGKDGGDLGSFYRFVKSHPGLTVVGAHLAGGMPFYAPMPEVRDEFEHVYVDTAAQRLLYDHTAYEYLIKMIGADHILFASDYPLVSQARQIEELRAGVFSTDDLTRILGGNAENLLAATAAR